MNKNIAFIDGQNLHMGTITGENPWKIDIQDANQELYEDIQNAGFILIFRQHNTTMIGKKKGNVDSDIIFNVMKRLYKKTDFNKILLVSGDGDYRCIIDFLKIKNIDIVIIAPNINYLSYLLKSTNVKIVILDDFKEKLRK